MTERLRDVARPGWKWHEGLGLRWDGGDGLVWLEPRENLTVALEVGQGNFESHELRELAAQMLALADGIDTLKAGPPSKDFNEMLLWAAERLALGPGNPGFFVAYNDAQWLTQSGPESLRARAAELVSRHADERRRAIGEREAP